MLGGEGEVNGRETEVEVAGERVFAEVFGERLEASIGSGRQGGHLVDKEGRWLENIGIRWLVEAFDRRRRGVELHGLVQAFPSLTPLKITSRILVVTNSIRDKSHCCLFVEAGLSALIILGLT